jgi:chromosome segregation ATPase
MVLLFVTLNFVPLPWNHNWLALQAAPAFALSDKEAAILKQTEELLRRAEKLKQSEIAEQLEDVMQQLQEGKIDAQQAAQMLDQIQSQLEEGNLDAASIDEGLEEIARDLQQSEKLEPTAEAMQNRQLNLAADELRKLAEKLGMNTPEASKEMQKSLQQAAENTRPGLEELARLLKEAAENLKDGQQQLAEQSLDGAAQELEVIQQRIDSQQLKNLASQQIQNLKDSLQQRQQAGQKGAKGQQQASNRGQNAQGQKPEPGQPQDGESQSSEAGNEGEPTDQASQQGQPGSLMSGGSEGAGLMPGGKGGADAPREGAPTSLDVKLQQEKVAGMQDGGEKPEDIEESSKQERSRLDYRNVKSDLSPAQKDLLNQDRIPWEYRPLIKDYFQAIRPTEKKQDP